MRYLLFLCLLVLTLPVLGYNEVVSAISYNPSRLGAYTHLKAIEKATLSGGLVQPEENGGRLNVLSKGTVAVACSNTTDECASANEITYIRPVAKSTSCASYSSLCEGWGTNQKGGNLHSIDINENPTGTQVTMYGGTLGNSNTNATVDSIVLRNGAQLVSVTANALSAPAGLVVQEAFVLGNITIAAPASSVMPGGSYKFITRVTDDKKKRSVLGLK